MPEQRRPEVARVLFAWGAVIGRLLSILALGIQLSQLPTPVAATSAPRKETARICDTAARKASRKSTVPLAVLMAVSRTETGQQIDGSLEPWPWTVNMQGVGQWFDSLDAARSYAFQHFKSGARSFDVGCFQVNYKWHHGGFASLDDMFDPDKNARYAARFLSELFEEYGNWEAAVGAYHSRTQKHAKRYLERFRAIRADLPQEPSSLPLMARRQPLFLTGPQSSNSANAKPAWPHRLGSLMPAHGRTSQPLISLD